MSEFSVIIPTLNAQVHLKRCLASIFAADPNVQVIVSDGGSWDATLDIAKAHQLKIVRAQQGRGAQLQEGASHADGDVLCFIHADSQLENATFASLRKSFNDPRIKIGKLKLVFDDDHLLLRFYALMARLDSLWTSFGDQGIIVRRSFYDALGGFRDWPLFEDVDFLRRARQRSAVRTLAPTIITGAERFKSGGYLKQQLKNGRLIVEYLRGASPSKLYEKYYQKNNPADRRSRPWGCPGR